jgi:DNA-binding transcriptional LysR family regulator
VTASHIIGAEVLPPILRDFRERHSHIAIELVLSNRNQDLSRRDADIAVRMVRPTQKALIARRLGLVKIAFFARREYLARHGTPRTVQDLAHHAIIGFDRDAVSLRWLAAEQPVARDAFALRTDDDQAQLNALRAGFGIGGCQTGIAARDPDLVPVLPGELGFKLEMWLAMHESLRTNRRTKLLFDHLALALKAYAASA